MSLKGHKTIWEHKRQYFNFSRFAQHLVNDPRKVSLSMARHVTLLTVILFYPGPCQPCHITPRNASSSHAFI